MNLPFFFLSSGMVFLNLLSVRRRWWRGKEVFGSTMFGAVAPREISIQKRASVR
jgi:hypothetical protein